VPERFTPCSITWNIRRVYRATPAGRKALQDAKAKVRELFSEIFEEEERHEPRKKR
jgi:DNA-binding PadR family transcriptional regulator